MLASLVSGVSKTLTSAHLRVASMEAPAQKDLEQPLTVPALKGLMAALVRQIYLSVSLILVSMVALA